MGQQGSSPTEGMNQCGGAVYPALCVPIYVCACVSKSPCSICMCVFTVPPPPQAATACVLVCDWGRAGARPESSSTQRRSFVQQTITLVEQMLQQLLVCSLPKSAS